MCALNTAKKAIAQAKTLKLYDAQSAFRLSYDSGANAPTRFTSPELFLAGQFPQGGGPLRHTAGKPSFKQSPIIDK